MIRISHAVGAMGRAAAQALVDRKYYFPKGSFGKTAGALAGLRRRRRAGGAAAARRGKTEHA